MGVSFYHHLSFLFKNYGLKKIAIYSKIKQTQIVYSCLFDLQYTKVLCNCISFNPSNLIHVKFKINWFLIFLFIAAMEISISFKDTL